MVLSTLSSSDAAILLSPIWIIENLFHLATKSSSKKLVETRNMPHNVKSKCQKIMRRMLVWKKFWCVVNFNCWDCTNGLKGIVQFLRSGSFLKAIPFLPFSPHYLGYGEILLWGFQCSCTKSRWLGVGALHKFVHVYNMSPVHINNIRNDIFRCKLLDIFWEEGWGETINPYHKLSLRLDWMKQHY